MAGPAAETLELRPGRGILGTGRHLVGAHLDTDGEVQGTLWLTFLYLPVLPLRSVRALPGKGVGEGGRRRLEVVGSETPALPGILATVTFGLLGWVLAWSPLAFGLYWLKRGSLLAPILHRAGEASWIQAVAGAADSFEGALRLLIGAWLLLLAAAVNERRRPHVASSRGSVATAANENTTEPTSG
jgi:hypothetical protein